MPSDVTLELERVQAIVEHLLADGSREGLILGDELNTAMGASARRRAARAAQKEETMPEGPNIVHALLNGDEATALVPGAIYPTMCGITWEYQDIGPSIRERFVCAACHQEQLEAMRATLNLLIDRYNTHLRTMHGQEGP